MYNTVLMSIIKSKTDLNNDRNSITPIQMSVLINEILYGNTFDILLNDIPKITLVTYTVDLNDICMIQRSNGFCFRIKSSDKLLI